MTKFTHSEKTDKVIIKFVRNFPNNLRLAFEKAGEAIGTTETSACSRYYSKLRDNSKALVMMTKDGISKTNVKNTYRRKEDDSMAVKIANAAVKKLTKQQRLTLVETIMND